MNVNDETLFFSDKISIFHQIHQHPTSCSPPRPAPGMIQILQQGILYGYMIQ